MPGTVSVACKLPNGLHLQLWQMQETRELVMGGGSRVVPKAVRTGPRVTLKGSAFAPNVGPGEHTIVGRYAITPDVDADYFDAWMKQNAENDVVKNRLVFAMPKFSDAVAKAKEQAGIVSGFEPANPNDKKHGVEPATRPS